MRRVATLVLGVLTLLAMMLFGTPAKAAVPDTFGFAMWDGAAAPANKKIPGATTIVPLVPGRFLVRFPGIGTPGGIVHVTTIQIDPNDKGRWCQAERWAQSGTDELVWVRCYRLGGQLFNAGFTVMFTKSSGLAPAGTGRHAYVDFTGAVSQYNSAGLVNSVTGGGGSWVVRMPGMASNPLAGNLQATAVNPEIGAHCKVFNWSVDPAAATTLLIAVRCFDTVGALLTTRWTLSFHERRKVFGVFAAQGRFGYLWNQPPVAAGPTNFNSLGGFNVNTVMPNGSAYLVRFPQIAAVPDHLQVVSYGTTAVYCTLTMPWVFEGTTVIQRNVECYNVNAQPAPSGFFASYASWY